MKKSFGCFKTTMIGFHQWHVLVPDAFRMVNKRTRGRVQTGHQTSYENSSAHSSQQAPSLGYNITAFL